MKILIKFVIISAFLSLNTIWSKESPENPRIEEYFQLLANEKIDFEPTGKVCERVAMREIESLYASANYNIVNSIRYDDKKTTIGELDLIIFNKSTGKVDAVAEVKCWKSFKGALKKAKEQRNRFLTNLNKKIMLFDETGKQYSQDLFNNIQNYFYISQAGGVNQGFDFELSLDFKELMQLRSKILDCKADSRRCPK